MELAFRTARTNQILSAISKAHASGDKGKYQYVLKISEDVMNLKTGVLDEALETKDGITALTITMGEIEKQNHKDSIMGNTTYDVSSFEALSDNFAARLGLGKELATGLEKIYRKYGGSEYSLKTRIVMTIIDIFTLKSIILLPFIMTSGVFGFFYSIMFISGIYARLDGRDSNNVYDKLTTRYKRVKEQIITYIKDVKLPPKDAQRAIESIEHIDKMMAEVSEYKGFIPIIFNLIDPASRASLKAKDVQGKLEMLAANDLYVKAAKIRTLD